MSTRCGRVLASDRGYGFRSLVCIYSVTYYKSCLLCIITAQQISLFAESPYKLTLVRYSRFADLEESRAIRETVVFEERPYGSST